MSNILSNAVQALAVRAHTWRSRQRAFEELSALDDRSLADIGISRAEIPYVIGKAPAPKAIASVPVTSLKSAA